MPQTHAGFEPTTTQRYVQEPCCCSRGWLSRG